MITDNRLMPIIGSGTIDDPLTNIPGLAELQKAARYNPDLQREIMRKQELKRSLANEAQPQDLETLNNNEERAWVNETLADTVGAFGIGTANMMKQ